MKIRCVKKFGKIYDKRVVAPTSRTPFVWIQIDTVRYLLRKSDVTNLIEMVQNFESLLTLAWFKMYFTLIAVRIE